MATETMKLNDVFPDWLTGAGIFSTLQTLAVPWVDENISQYLDLEYHGNVSGDKIISPLVYKSLTDGELSDNMRLSIATTILSLYGSNWAKQWATLELTYNPIHNYDMIELLTSVNEIEYGKIRTHKINEQHGKTGTETQTPNLTTESQDNVSGFNSDSSVPANDTTETATGTNTITYNTVNTDRATNKDTDGGSDSTTINHQLSRSGNIGVTTTQQMITSERELWKWNFFENVVFPDVDRVLTLQIY